MGYIGPGAAWNAAAAAGTDWDLVTMVAIAGAESGWNTSAVSSTNDYGLWQINTYYWGELFNQYTWDNANDNAQMAHHVWRSGGYSQWVTYQTGAYRNYLDQAQAAAGTSDYSGGGGGGSDVVVQPPDWSGWDWTARINATGQNLINGMSDLSYYIGPTTNLLNPGG